VESVESEQRLRAVAADAGAGVEQPHVAVQARHCQQAAVGLVAISRLALGHAEAGTSGFASS
jgi:hypothetical protein